MLINQLFLSLFFVYFVLMSGECSEIMNCNLQRYINDNNWLKHIMIFLSIYIFTFVLNWYTIESLTVENFKENKKEETHYLLKSFYYTIVIYLIFILSTKNEGKYAFIFLFVSILIVILTLYNKSINSEIYLELNTKFFINNKIRKKLLKKYKNNKNDINKIVLLENIIFVASILIILVLFYGSYKYYLRQYKTHKKNWSWLVFWFGYNRQCKIKRS